MDEHKRISIIYGTLIILGIILGLLAFIFIPTKTVSIDNGIAKEEIAPTSTENVSEDIRVFHFTNVDWKTNGSCLHFLSSHQEIKVEADGQTLFERYSAGSSIWGRTPGYSYEYFIIPEETKEVTVTVTAVYPIVRDSAITFYQGFVLNMFKYIFRQESFNEIISIFNLVLGLILLIYGTVTHKKSSLGTSMVYLGTFTILLSLWSLTENGIMALLVDNRTACSFVSYTTLSLIGLPFIMFVHCYLKTADKCLHRVLLAFNIINAIVTFTLQAIGVADMKETLTMTHLAMLGSVLYLPFSMVSIIKKRLFNRRFWITVCSLFSMCPPLIYSLFLYYSGSHNVDSYGNVFLFVFVAIFAVDVSLTIFKDIDAGKKAAIYQELAEKDLLTGCYNRNAYKNDTNEWTILNDVLLITCDLNNLKQCNDTLGHACGDKYISDSAEMLKKLFSKYGKVYRIGGDEFCIIIPDGSNCNINKLLGNLLEEERMYNAVSTDINLQIACGYARFNPETDSNMEDIRNRADELMYQNKKELKAWKIV